MNIDHVLLSLGMGQYQFVGCLLFGLAIMFAGVSPITYVFTAGDLKYRCVIPECDPSEPAERIYEPDWLKFTTPHRHDSGLPRKCQRYAVVMEDVGGQARCSPDKFDRNTTQWCRGSWVFEDAENTIGTEFGLMCQENKWQLSLVGSVNSFGQFVGIPVSGVIADKFGRKFTMVFSAVLSAIIAIIQSFSTNYPVFLILELISSTVSSGMYAATFVLALESVLPNQRVLYYSILECFFPFGATFVALVANQVKDWRLLLRITNIPGLLFLSYLWTTDESMRWLQMQGKHDRVFNILKKIAGANKKPLPVLSMNTNAQTITSNEDTTEDCKDYASIVSDVIHSPAILKRVISCSFLWTAIILVYFGLSINATDIDGGNKYLNFSLVSLVEIPACVLNWMVMEGLSRKMALSSMFVMSGVTSVAYAIAPSHISLLKLLLYLINKLTIASAFAIIYVLTAEIFPTRLRTTLLAVCSMIGRIGSILAPQMTLLGDYFGEYLPMLVYGLTSLLGAAVTMTLPESKNIKLPDTVNEAEQLGADSLLPSDNTTENLA